MALHRLFIAIRPPLSIRDALRGMASGVPGARWQNDEQLHCTLRFIGEVDHHRAEDAAAVLGNIRHAPFDLRLGRYGTFDRDGRIDTLWVGVTPGDDIRALHHKVDRALGTIGVAPDSRAYLPHITLARFARGAGVSPDVVCDLPPLPALAFRVEDMRLYESQLGSSGATYEAIARYPLG